MNLIFFLLRWFEKHDMVLSERYKSGFLRQGGSYYRQ